MSGRAASPGAPPRLVIADGDLQRRGACSAGLRTAGLQVCAQAASADAAVRDARREHPDIVLVAMDLPGGGLGATSAIVGDDHRTRVVMTADSPQDEQLFSAIAAGAVGCLPSRLDAGALAATLFGVAAGEAALSRVQVAGLVDEFRRRYVRSALADLGASSDPLTDRELEVLRLLAHGLSTKEIANRLYIAAVTVRSHVAAAVRKLGVADRDAAVGLARHYVSALDTATRPRGANLVSAPP